MTSVVQEEVAHSKDDFLDHGSGEGCLPTPKTTLLVQEVVAWLMVQEVTLVEALLGRERQSER
jgi:hypothetical protein